MEKHSQGDKMKVWKLRTSSVVIFLISIWYLEWLVKSINIQAWYISLPFFLASILLALNTLVSIVNHWRFKDPQIKLVKKGEEPLIGVLIPTYNEPIDMVIKTAKSVFDQNWPKNKIVLVISDDGHNNALRLAVQKLQSYYKALIFYHEPPLKNSPLRKGESKSGNLNSALEFLNTKFPEIEFIETRDADDLVGDKDFLRHCLGQLLADSEASFVQTIKECIVSEGDPFGNQEAVFYRRTMLAKYVCNAAFPCGSGLIWRKSHLERIDGFPAWNLVEDLQSGFEIYQKGGKGIHLPIVGAIGQIAPEDIPNFFKQRGTWALDSMRLFFWKNPFLTKGLTFMQKLQFLELELFYLLGFCTMTFAFTMFFILLFNIYPVNTSVASYTLHVWPYLVAMELFLVFRGDGLSYKSLWRSRQMWLGLAPIYIKASILALLYGPNKKPSYKVTRKTHQYGWYWRETLIQSVSVFGLSFALVYYITHLSNLSKIDLNSIFWACFFIIGLSKVVKNSWFGFSLRKPSFFPL